MWVHVGIEADDWRRCVI